MSNLFAKYSKRFLAFLFCFTILFCSEFLSLSGYNVQAASKLKHPTITGILSTSSTAAKITWKKSVKAKKYKVLRATSKKGKYKVLSTVKKTKRNFVDKKLSTGKTYFYKISAIAGSKKATSKIVKYRAVPKKVTGVSATRKSNNSILIKWTKNSNVSGYQIYLSTSYSFKSNLSKIMIKSASKNNTVASVAKNKKYYFKVRAFKTVNNKAVYGFFSKKANYTLKATNSITDKFPDDITKSKLVYNKDDSTIFTRSQWIKELSDKLGLKPIDSNQNFGYSFSDISEDPNADIIEAFYQKYKMPESTLENFDENQDVNKFEPNSYANREFAAYTSILAMGFVVDKNLELTYLDSNEANYPYQIQLAIVNNFMNTNSSNYFKPLSLMSGTDRNQIFAKIDQIKKSENFDTSKTYEKIVYQSGTKTYPNSGYKVSKSNGLYKITYNSSIFKCKVDDIIIFPANDNQPNGLSIKAVLVKENGKNSVVQGVVPQAEEVFNDMKFQGEGEAELGKISTFEGVTCKIDDNTSSKEDLVSSGATINGDITIKNNSKLTLDFSKSISSNSTIKGSVEFSIPEVKARVNAHVGWNGLEFNDLLISISKKAVFKGAVSSTALTTGYEITHGSGKTEFKPGSWDLVTIPIKLGATGLSVDIIVGVNVSVKGEISLTYTLTNTCGLQYTNGTMRSISGGTQDLSDVKISASAKAGINLRIGLWALGAFNLVGFKGEVGLAADASFTSHSEVTPTVYCGEAAIYVYFTVGTDDDCLLTKFTHLKWSVDIWNSSNSPFVRKYHIENGRIVNSCQFSSGGISGKVIDNINLNPISLAKIEIYKGSAKVFTLYSLSDGSFNVNNLPSGDYSIVVSATGYFKYTSEEKVTSNLVTFAEPYKMITRDGQENGAVSGNIEDAVNGDLISNVKYAIYEGWNNNYDNPIDTGTVNEFYKFTLAPGNYTLKFEAPNYTMNMINVAIISDNDTQRNVILNPYDASLEGQFRVILTWGYDPEDIDSHMYGPTVNSDSTFHVFYDDMEYYSNGETISCLDRDDIDQEGPETITVNQMNRNGTYSYYVHDYSNRSSSNSTDLSESNAIVKVYMGNTLKAVFNIPTGREGTVWHVFDYDAATDQIIPVNDFYYQQDPNYVNSDLYYPDDDDYDDDYDDYDDDYDDYDDY